MPLSLWHPSSPVGFDKKTPNWGLLIKTEGATGEFVIWLYCYIWVTSSLGGDFLIWVGTLLLFEIMACLRGDIDEGLENDLINDFTLYGSSRKRRVPCLGFLIIRILLFKGTILGSPIFGNSLRSTMARLTGGTQRAQYPLIKEYRVP